MNKINRFTFKHISSIFLFSVLTLFIWCFFIYVFFDCSLKRELSPLIENSKQLLYDIVNKDLDSEKIKKFVYETEKSDYVRYVRVINKKVPAQNKKKSFFISLLEISYPIKNKDSVAGYVEILPSHKLFDEVFSDGVNLTVLIFSVFVLLCFLVFAFYFCMQKYIVQPFNQIRTVINDILSNEEISVDENNGYAVWNEVFGDLKKLNNNVFDINTTMKLLFSTSNAAGSDFELVNSVQLIFDIIKKRIKTAMCALFVPDDSGHLKIVAKSGFIKNDIALICKDENNFIWNCYEKSFEVFINDISGSDKKNLGDLYDDTDGSFATLPLIDEDLVCMGVLVVITKTKDSFHGDVIGFVKNLSGHLIALIKRMKYYKKIKETSRKLETELQTTSKELAKANDLIVKKVKDLNLLSDVYSYICKKIDIRDIIAYIINKVKESVAVETAGILIYNKDEHSLTCVKNSFGLDRDLNFYNKKGTIYDKVIENKSTVVFNSVNEMDGYLKDDLQNYVKINSAVFVPVLVKDAVYAIFAAVNKNDSDRFGAYDVKMLEHISGIFSGIIKI